MVVLGGGGLFRMNEVPLWMRFTRHVQGVGSRVGVWGVGCRVHGLGLKGFGFQVVGLGCRGACLYLTKRINQMISLKSHGKIKLTGLWVN